MYSSFPPSQLTLFSQLYYIAIINIILVLSGLHNTQNDNIIIVVVVIKKLIVLLNLGLLRSI